MINFNRSRFRTVEDQKFLREKMEELISGERLFPKEMVKTDFKISSKEKKKNNVSELRKNVLKQRF
jgi:hypothetical protein